MADKIKSVQWIPINSVKLWKDNPRKNNSAAKKLAPLLEEHGIKSPLVVWNKNNVIYKGNTTYKAAKLIGLKTIPVAFVDFPSLSAAKAYAIADNKASEYSEWDDDVLRGLMKSKELKKPNKTGFAQEEIESLFGLSDTGSEESVEGLGTGPLLTVKLICMPDTEKALRKFLAKKLPKKFDDAVVIKA